MSGGFWTRFAKRVVKDRWHRENRPTRGSVAAAVIYAGTLVTLALCSAGALAILLDCWPRIAIGVTAGVVTWCGWECIREVGR